MMICIFFFLTLVTLSNPRLCGPSCPRPAAFLDWQQPSRRFSSVIDTIRLGPAYLVDPNRDFLFLLT